MTDDLLTTVKAALDDLVATINADGKYTTKELRRKADALCLVGERGEEWLRALLARCEAAEAERDAARADLHAARQACNDEHPEVGQVYAALAAARAEVARLRGLVDEVRACGTEDDDPRLRYMIVQIDKGLWGDLKAALDTPEREGA